MSARRLQHSKGKHRPRRWHMGQAQGVINERLMTSTIEPAFEAAERDRQAAKARAEQHRDEQRRARKDESDQLAQLDRVAPFVPSWEISL